MVKNLRFKAALLLMGLAIRALPAPWRTKKAVNNLMLSKGLFQYHAHKEDS